jgi:translation initiation factor IF-2
MQVSGGSMSKVRVYEVAKQLNLDPKQVVTLFQSLGVNDVRNHMSSVEPEQVERVKRHLEKQKTHDVVEERIRPTVIKRRAVAKAGADAQSSPAVPAAPPSAAQLDVASTRQDLLETVAEVVAKDRESVARVPSAPKLSEDRKSSRAVEPSAPSVPADRASVRGMPAAQPVEPPPPAPSERLVAAPSASEAKPAAPPSVRASETMQAAQPAAEEAAASGAFAAAQASAEEPAPRSEQAPPSQQETPRAPVQKTGVEYWTGRPGVPMPTPVGAQRTGIGGGATGAMPRRVQYDPRAGAGTQQRRDMRGGAQGGRMGMMGRPGQGRRGVPAAPSVKRAVSTQEMAAHKKVVRIEENITLQAMAAKMSLKATELLMKLLGMGMTGVHINTTLDADTAKILASEFGWEVEDTAVSEEQSIAEARGEDLKATELAEDQVLRPPVVTVMGHVDHGKTSLLDKIRKANVAAGEAGGITQHIGAYKVQTPHGTIVFLDTPGHEAFTAMRARGASVTDIVVLVVAADDGVMPQTKEAINHAKAAEVPIIVAINKIDKPTAEPDRVKRELVELGLTPEEWGGDTIYCNVSALTGEGIDKLLEMVALQSEVMDLKANPKKPASGAVLEALLDRGRGPVARVLVQDGTLKVGDFVLAGPGFGKVRAMTNEHGKQIHEAGPATPVEILGLSEIPGAGDPMHVVKDPKKAQEIAESRKGKISKSLVPATAKVSLEELSKRIQDSEQLELRVIIKGDVQGSVEAVADALSKLSGERVRLSIIHAGVGAITEGDVNLAIAAKAIIVGFNVRPAGKASSLAEENKIEIRLYSIIYNVVDDVKSAMEGLLPPTLVEKAHGKAEVRQLFKVKGVVVAGCYVTEGTIKRSAKVRIVRDGVVAWDGKLAALKRFKDDVKEVAQGLECGLSFESFNDVKEKDVVECYEIEEIKQSL